MQRANRLINIRITAVIQVNIQIATMGRQEMSIRTWLSIIKIKLKKPQIPIVRITELKILPVITDITAMKHMIMLVLIIPTGEEL